MIYGETKHQERGWLIRTDEVARQEQVKDTERPLKSFVLLAKQVDSPQYVIVSSLPYPYY